MFEGINADLWKAKVNSLIGILFLGSFALGAGLMIWNVASDENPVANALVAHMQIQDTSSM